MRRTRTRRGRAPGRKRDRLPAWPDDLIRTIQVLAARAEALPPRLDPPEPRQ